MNKRLAATAMVVAAGAATAGLFVEPSASSSGTCTKALACSISLTATGPSPSALTAPAMSDLSFDNTDSVSHTVVFANGHCSITLAPGEQVGPGVEWANGVEHPDCNDNLTFYVGSYPYTVDGKFAGTVITTPLRRAVSLTAPTHGIRRGTSLTLHGRVNWLQYNPAALEPQQFRVIVLARHDGRHAFKPITTGRLWSSESYAHNGTISYSWKRKVHPGETTTYVAKVTGYQWFWSDATSRAFTVRIRH